MLPCMPATVNELSELLCEQASRNASISLSGNRSKHRMGGPVLPSDINISTGALRRVLEYEPRDLTISVEAGLPFSELQKLLAVNGQMIALDPPFVDRATIGGVVASNSSGPSRRAYGTARDLVIGMTFVTLEGKLVKSGGMVVKNVAGLDMAKLMIGSFGTLAAIASLNFRLHSIPEATKTFLYSFKDADSALAKRNEILRSVLQPLALDLLSPAAAVRVARRGFVLALRAGGSEAVLKRYERELGGAEVLPAADDREFWRTVQEFTPEFLSRQPDGVVMRISTPLQGMPPLLKLIANPFICRAANGITHVYASSWAAASRLWKTVSQLQLRAVIEFAPGAIRESEELWRIPVDGPEREAFVMMEKVKQMFDPGRLLNRNRLYGRI